MVADTTAKQRQIEPPGNQEYWNVADLHPSPHNPARRTYPEMLKALQESIAAYGVLTPLLITPLGVVIDGHRRLAAAKAAGIERVPVRVITEDAEAVFTQVNTTARRLTGREWLDRHLQGGQSDPKLIALLERWQEIDDRLLSAIIERGLAPMPFDRLVRRTARTIGWDSRHNHIYRKLASYLIVGNRMWQMRQALGQRASPDVLIAAIDGDKDLFTIWSASVHQSEG